MELVVALIAGLAIFIVVVGALAGPYVDPVQARLAGFGATVPGQTLEELELQRPLFERTLRPLISRLANVMQRVASPGRLARTERRMALAGNPGGVRTMEFLALRVLFAVLGSVVVFALIGVLGRSPVFGLVFAAALAGFGFLVPEFWLSRRIKARRQEVLLAVPDTLDLLTISVRAGLGFDAALAKVVEKTRGPLADEFTRALAEIRVGKTRRDALRDIVPRTEVQALTNFIGAIIQAEQLGVSISKVLQVQSEQLRIERRQRAEEMAAKAPIKMLFPLIGCIFPSMFIVILGPPLILIIQSLVLRGP